uniref:Homeobox domain-containing protein n=1 Tax=Paramoeba aestuarina TaxID=180227 RepID=A0A7S4L493_9EUKA|mmetsp:Transcript_31178/g.48628  ORF Transcript_31178/g.48628 Transcript_31178/m.48628 type:complete len:440 (+) Transcript_31178:161-1480(+)
MFQVAHFHAKRRKTVNFFTDEQRAQLEQHFQQQREQLQNTNKNGDTSAEVRASIRGLSEKINLSEAQIRGWLRNRKKRGEYKGRKLHHPKKIRALEWVFQNHTNYPTVSLNKKLAVLLEMDYKQVKKWFQSRRHKREPSPIVNTEPENRQQWALLLNSLKELLRVSLLLKCCRRRGGEGGVCDCSCSVPCSSFSSTSSFSASPRAGSSAGSSCSSSSSSSASSSPTLSSLSSLSSTLSSSLASAGSSTSSSSPALASSLSPPRLSASPSASASPSSPSPMSTYLPQQQRQPLIPAFAYQKPQQTQQQLQKLRQQQQEQQQRLQKLQKPQPQPQPSLQLQEQQQQMQQQLFFLQQLQHQQHQQEQLRQQQQQKLKQQFEQQQLLQLQHSQTLPKSNPPSALVQYSSSPNTRNTDNTDSNTTTNTNTNTTNTNTTSPLTYL